LKLGGSPRGLLSGAPDAFKEIVSFMYALSGSKIPFDVIYAKNYSPTDRTTKNYRDMMKMELLYDTGVWDLNNWVSNKAIRKEDFLWFCPREIVRCRGRTCSGQGFQYIACHIESEAEYFSVPRVSLNMRVAEG